MTTGQLQLARRKTVVLLAPAVLALMTLVTLVTLGSGCRLAGRATSPKTARIIGFDVSYQSQVASADNVEREVFRLEHGCLLDSAGRVLCWGNNDYGQLGRDCKRIRSCPRPGETPCRRQPLCRGDAAAKAKWRRPALVRGLRPMVAVATGVRSSCALDRAGRLYCWGDSDRGQLGLSYRVRASDVPLRVPLRRPAIAIVGGDPIHCALLDTFELSCWGQPDPLHRYQEDGPQGSGIAEAARLERLRAKQDEQNKRKQQDTRPATTPKWRRVQLPSRLQLRLEGRPRFIGKGRLVDAVGKLYAFGHKTPNLREAHTCQRPFAQPPLVQTAWRAQRAVRMWPELQHARAIAATRSCALLEASVGQGAASQRSRRVVCWGSNADGKTGRPADTSDCNAPKPPLTERAISGLPSKLVALSERPRERLAWTTEAQLTAEHRAIHYYRSRYYREKSAVCALDSAGAVYCWGAVVVAGKEVHLHRARRITLPGPARMLNGGCALLRDGRFFCEIWRAGGAVELRGIAH
jgi:alpha-tubulin suppressor-like RCC1 family protein